MIKRLLITLALLTASAWAQQGNSVTIRFTGVPTGSCSPVAYGVNNATGDLYDCLNGAWHLIGTAGTSPNGVIFTPWPSLPNFANDKINASNVGTGDIDLYTVPAGKRAIVVYSFWNSTASSINFFSEVKIGATYYAVSTRVTLASTATASTAFGIDIILEAGQKFSVNTSATGLNIVGTVYLWDAVAYAPKSAVITTFINGDNTVYTCCAAGFTKSFILGHAGGLFSGAATAAGVFGYNNTAGTLTYHWNLVPSAGSPGTANQMSTAISSAATAGVPVTFSVGTTAGSFGSGDFLSVNGTSTNAAQIAWVNTVEQP